MDCALVSVIVPIYNIENYLPRCCESIAAQSFEDIEVLLVDDGSTDNSASVARLWASRDNRFSVIPRDNGGLAEARNIGLEHAHGEWIMAVDGDDFLPLHAIERLWANVSNDVDVVVGQWQLFDDGTEPIENTVSSATLTMSGSDALDSILYQDGHVNGSVCARLIRRSLFDTVRFPAGRLYEDLAVAPSLYGNARQVTIIGDTVYYYRQHRPGSILNVFTASRADVLDILEQIEAQCDERHRPAVEARLMAAAFNLWRLAPRGDEFDALRVRCREIIKRVRTRCIGNGKVRLRDRVAAIGSYLLM